MHGYDKTGQVIDFFDAIIEEFKSYGVDMIAPFFQSGEKTDYATWEKVFAEYFSDDIDTVVTHSMGARAAIEYVIANKKQIKRMVLVAPSLESRKPGSNVQDFYDELKQDVSILRSFAEEIIIVSSQDDVGREGKARAFAESVGAKHIEISGQ